MLNPTHSFLLHSRWPKPVPFAHRGYSALYPENTLAAFEAAVSLGYEYLETDVQATQDGHLVVFHDDTLDRLTGQHGCIDDLTLSEVRALRVRNSDPIPLLADLLHSFPEVRINIDPKTDSATAPLLRLLGEINAWERVCAASFSGRRLEYMRNEAGERLCTATSPSEIARLWLARYYIPVGQIAANCVQVPPHRYVQIIDNKFVAESHKHGLPVHVWTINDTNEMKPLLDCSIDGIMSDEAESTMKFFQQHVWSN